VEDGNSFSDTRDKETDINFVNWFLFGEIESEKRELSEFSGRDGKCFVNMENWPGTRISAEDICHVDFTVPFVLGIE
jgi:hypothetical protein